LIDSSKQPSSSIVEEALRDLRNRTLARLDGDFAKLVYLASTRDYNTGRYAHDGLSFRFSEPIVQKALAAAHCEVFATLALSPLRILVGHVERYIESGCARPDELVAAWNGSEVYRILPPTAADPLTIRLFISNIKVALAIVKAALLEHRQSQHPQFSLQLPSPGR
jgi:hypothetical protein